MGVTPLSSQALFGASRLTPLGSPRFGKKDKPPEPPKPETSEETPAPPEKLVDPKPTYGRKNLKYLAFAGLSLFAFLKIPAWTDGFHGWTEIKSKEEITTLIPTKESPEEPVLEVVSKIDQFIQDNKALRYPTTYYEFILRWQMLWLTVPLLRSASRRYIEPEEFWKDFHRMGFRGGNMKVGIIGEGLNPTRNLPDTRIDLFDLEKSRENPQKPNDSRGRETAIANIISRAVPASSFVGVKELPDMARDSYVNGLYSALRNKELDMLTRAVTMYKPLVESMAAGVKKAVDEGSNVVLVPRLMDASSHHRNIKDMMGSFLGTQVPGIRHLLHTTKPHTLTPDDAKELAKLTYFMTDQLSRFNLDWAMENGLGELLAPWKEALDYAQIKEVPVLLPAGDSGANFHDNPNTVGNMNLLAMLNHPAQIVVASGTSKDKIKRVSSEGGATVKPDITANGHGEIASESKITKDWTIIIWPFKYVKMSLDYKNPSNSAILGANVYSTPFACADVANVILMMKQVHPEMTIADAKSILAETANPAKPSLEMVDYLELLQERVLKKANNLDATNTANFIVQLQRELENVIDDPKKSSELAHSLYDKDLQRSGGDVTFKSFSFSKMALQNMTAEEQQDVIGALLKTLETFELTEVKTSSAESRLDRKGGAGMIARREAVSEAQRRAKQKEADAEAEKA